MVYRLSNNSRKTLNFRNMILIFYLLILVAIIIWQYNPSLDKLSTGEYILWYNVHGRFNKTERDYIKIG